jgi:hypothetical protein
MDDAGNIGSPRNGPVGTPNEARLTTFRISDPRRQQVLSPSTCAHDSPQAETPTGQSNLSLWDLLWREASAVWATVADKVQNVQRVRSLPLPAAAPNRQSLQRRRALKEHSGTLAQGADVSPAASNCACRHRDPGRPDDGAAGRDSCREHAIRQSALLFRIWKIGGEGLLEEAAEQCECAQIAFEALDSNNHREPQPRKRA